MKVLFLFESILPKTYHSQTIAPGELRVIAAQPTVDHVYAMGRAGKSFYDIDPKSIKKTKLEDKISIVPISGFSSSKWYYVTGIILFVHALLFLKKHKIDLIHAESPHISGPFAILLGKLCKVPVCIEYRASYDEIIPYRIPWIPYELKLRLYVLLEKWVFSRCAAVLANSKTYEIKLKKLYPYINICNYTSGVRLPDVHKKKGNSSLTIGFIGRLYPDKGPLYALKAIHSIKSTMRKTGAKFLVAGEGPLESEIKTYIQQHSLSDIVDILGTQDRWKFLLKCDLLVNTTIVKAALEMVIAEAAAVQIPCVSFGDSTYPETVIDQVTGYKVKNKDFVELGNMVKKLIYNHDLRHKMGRAAYQHYKNNYTYEQQVEKLSKVYSQFL